MRANASAQRIGIAVNAPFTSMLSGANDPLHGIGVPDEPPLRVMALHALLYCERLFYLEEVEEIRVADAAVYAGRRLHVEVATPDDETPEQRSFEVSSERWGLLGKVDAVRRRDGHWGRHRAQARAMPSR